MFGPPCAGCSCFTYSAVMAKWKHGGGADSKATFTAAYLDAVTRVKGIDIATVAQSKVRYFDYSAADGSFVDHGNVVNDGTQWPGIVGFGAGVSDLGQICPGSPSGWLAYVANPYNFYGNNPFGGQQAHWDGPDTGDGWFLVMRMAVWVLNKPCDVKWAMVNWDNNWFPSPGFYSFDCVCDATGPGSCPACTNDSDTSNVVCVDIPDPTSFFQYDATLPCSSRYFVPGGNCADLS